jgi:integrase
MGGRLHSGMMGDLPRNHQGILPTLPLMPRVSVKDNPRPWFDYSEYLTLLRATRRLAKEAKNNGDNHRAERFLELTDFIGFMVNTFLRPSEWANLRHRHIKVAQGHDAPHISLAVADGKTKPRVVYSMPSGPKIYARIKARTGSNPENYLFKNQYFVRKTALAKMRDDFDEALKASGLEYDQLGIKRTIYSLRHSSIMFRLLRGDNVDYQTLVMNAGTSLDQLHRFYASHLDPLMNLKNLQSMKKMIGKKGTKLSI